MKLFGFRPPQEKIEPRLWVAENDFTNINAGKFIRNAVLSGMSVANAERVPGWLKTRDAVHPLVGGLDIHNTPIPLYGSYNASAAAANAKFILQVQNTTVWWTPGGNGIGSWLSVTLPEATLVESYGVGTKAASTPLSWVLQGSMDNTVWADLHTVDNTGVWDVTYEFKEFLIPEESRGAYLYYRLSITGSNSTSMSLRNFRLFRPSSICAKGELLLDASVAKPFVLSFADGFDVDGVTPVDIIETISMPILNNMMDITTQPAVASVAGTGVVTVNLYAIRTAPGNVVIESELADQQEIVQAAGGMTAQISKGWECTSALAPWWSNFGRIDTPTTPAVISDVRFLKTDAPNGVYVSRIHCPELFYYSSSKYIRIPVYVIEMDDSLTEINSSYTFTVSIERRIKGIKTSMPSSSNPSFRGFALYSPAKLFKRMNGGKLYSRESPVDAWTQCYRILIGSCSIDKGSGEVYSPYPFCSVDINALLYDSPVTDISG